MAIQERSVRGLVLVATRTILPLLFWLALSFAISFAISLALSVLALVVISGLELFVLGFKAKVGLGCHNLCRGSFRNLRGMAQVGEVVVEVGYEVLERLGCLVWMQEIVLAHCLSDDRVAQ